MAVLMTVAACTGLQMATGAWVIGTPKTTDHFKKTASVTVAGEADEAMLTLVIEIRFEGQLQQTANTTSDSMKIYAATLAPPAVTPPAPNQWPVGTNRAAVVYAGEEKVARNYTIDP